jgi:F-type H+-transporting ATPase subunit k
MEELEQGLTYHVQQLAIGVLSTMFGGIALLSGGSSKAVQQSPPIKASSRGEEDFIQYVSKCTCDTLQRDPSGSLEDRIKS